VTSKDLSRLSYDELGDYRVSLDEQIEVLRNEKRRVGQHVADRDAQEALERALSTVPEDVARRALAHVIEGVGGIDSQESVKGIG
jgi:hypothetical protein